MQLTGRGVNSRFRRRTLRPTLSGGLPKTTSFTLISLYAASVEMQRIHSDKNPIGFPVTLFEEILHRIVSKNHHKIH